MRGESPDAIGYRVSDMINGGSTIVECKVSRSDFLADRKKPHRQTGGMGKWRYFMCPEGLISPDELPDKWGLLHVGARNCVTPLAGPAFIKPAWGSAYENALADYAHEHDTFRETLMLANLLHRLGDPGAMNTRLRTAEGTVRAQMAEIYDLRKEVRDMRQEKWLKRVEEMSKLETTA
ncbi:hypothetical protein GCM10007866_16160 [Gluconobacter albidus]|nr:hypothetical protein AA3250_1966 [Gluconobacter albidus NBRC 3250]GLQ69165.1 hypothetical protein GCM10007866_16160 [Gluconobacter albidus]